MPKKQSHEPITTTASGMRHEIIMLRRTLQKWLDISHRLDCCIDPTCSVCTENRELIDATKVILRKEA